MKYEQNIELYYKEAIKCFDQGVAFKHDNIGIYKKREWDYRMKAVSLFMHNRLNRL